MSFNYEKSPTTLAADLSLPADIEAVILKSIQDNKVSSVKMQGVASIAEISATTNIAELTSGGTINVSALPASLEALVISGATPAVLTITDPAFDGTVVFANSANNRVTTQNAKNVAVQGGDGSDTIVTSTGKDTIVTGAGNDSVSTGAGTDKVIVTAAAGDRDTVDTGSGVDRIAIGGALSASDVGGRVTAAKQGNDLVISLPSGQSVTVKNGEVIEFADGTAIAATSTKVESAMMRLYKGFIGREMDADGAAWWLGNLRDNPTKTIQDVVRAFAGEAETRPIMTAATNDAFLDALYTKAFGRAGDSTGKQYWLDQLATGGKSRVDVVASFMWSNEAGTKIVGVIETDGSV